MRGKKGECTIIYFIQGTKNGCTIIYEDLNDGKVHTKSFTCSCLKLLKALCIQYELDFDGARKAIAINHGYKQKIPIYIKENGLLLYPLNSLRDKANIWINYYAVRKISGNDEQTMISFGRYHSFSQRMIYKALSRQVTLHTKAFDYDVRIIRKQMERCRCIDDFVKQDRNEILS